MSLNPLLSYKNLLGILSKKHVIIVIVGLIMGLVLRYIARDYMTSDARHYILRWYEHARANGLDSLGHIYPN